MTPQFAGARQADTEADEKTFEEQAGRLVSGLQLNLHKPLLYLKRSSAIV